jgi:serine phosphatase RsbU (regulator of sigma subunit)
MARHSGPSRSAADRVAATAERLAAAAGRAGKSAERFRGSPPWDFLETYTRDLNSRDFRRLFTLETPEAYRFFARAINEDALAPLPWHVRWWRRAHQFFVAFTSRLSPARRAIYGIALVFALLGLLMLFQGIHMRPIPPLGIPLPTLVWPDGSMWLFAGFLLMNLLVLLEVADRLTLKRDLEIAREIQLAMLPREMVTGGGLEAYGFTRPANTVGGDFYDVLQVPDGRLVIGLGDVSGKGSPAALLMALTLAMLRTLIEENLEPTELMRRLNVQVARHAPGSRFVTLCLAFFDPDTGDLEYINAGQTPPLLRRSNGTLDRLSEGGVALGMFDLATYTSGRTSLGPGDVLVFYSDGITEAESKAGVPFDESGLQAVIERHWWEDAAMLGKAVVRAVEEHAVDTRLPDDLTVLAIRRPMPIPVP